MKNIYALLFAFGATTFLFGDAYADETKTSGGDVSKSAMAKITSLNLAAETDTPWPPAGCLDAEGIRKFRRTNPGKEADYGLYSGDDTATSNGNIFWLGSNHGANVLPPDKPISVKPSDFGEGFLLRWNISDTVIIDNSKANEQISNHYKWDYDKNRDGDYAVNAIAINKCEKVDDNFVCEQALFGQAAWEKDYANGGFELCPPVILPEDQGSIYIYDLNDNSVVEQYEYSLGLILTAGGIKSGLRVIIDPKITNGGAGQR